MTVSLKLVTRSAIALIVLALAVQLRAQSTPTTFQYFYDDLGQLIKVIDSSGNLIAYNYDQVGNITSITRGQAPSSGTLAIFDFTPQMGPAGTTVTIQGQAFNAIASSNAVTFNGATATVVSATTNSLLVTVPATASTGLISVTVASQTATTTNNFTFTPVPAITSISPTFLVSSLTGPSIFAMQVTGAALTSATFAFSPATTPPQVAVSSATINPTGTSATLSLTVAAGVIGTFTLIATNSAGPSSALGGPNNTLQLLDPNGDADGDGLTNIVEIAIGTNPLNPASSGVGLPDGWQVFYGLNPLNPATAAAIAPDGFTILRNFQISHDPTNANLTPPSVSQVIPANGATKVPINDSVVLRYSEPLLTGTSLTTAQAAITAALGSSSTVPAASQQIAAQTLQAYMNRTCCGNSVVPGTLTVAGPAGAVTGAVAASSDGRYVTFAHSQPLLSNTTFTVQAQGVRDVAGNVMTNAFSSSFTTGSTLDTTVPQIVSTNPADGASNVPTSANIVVTFSKPIDPSSLTPTSFSVLDYITNLPISGTIQVDPSGTSATFLPSPAFASGDEFLVALTTAIKDLAGNYLAGNFSFGFATGTLTSGEADIIFSALNTKATSGSQAANDEADTVFSVLNTEAPAGALAAHAEADTLFSVLNTQAPVGSLSSNQEADAIIFSVNNTATAPAVKSAEKPKSITPPTPIDSDGDGYPDDLEKALGSDPNDPNSVPKVNPIPFVDGVVFSVQNDAPPGAEAANLARRKSNIDAGVDRTKSDPRRGAFVRVAFATPDQPESTEGVTTFQESRLRYQNIKGVNHEKVFRSHNSSFRERILGLFHVHPSARVFR